MRRILRPTVAGLNVARHLVWYLNHQISGDVRDQDG